MPIALNICAMSCWAPNAAHPSAWLDWAHQQGAPHGDSPPDLTHIKPMQRRRLSLLARAVFHVGKSCLDSCQHPTNRIASLFATTYGQADAAAKMLQTIAEQKPLSPTAFSLSVHNAIAGQFSIAHGLTGSSMTAAAGREGIGGIFTQAAGLLNDPDYDAVLVCCFEAPLPDSLKPYTTNPPTPMAAAFLLEPAALSRPTDNDRLDLNMTRSSNTRDTSDTSAPTYTPFWSQILSFVAFLQEDDQQLDITSNHINYHWSRSVDNTTA